MIIKKTAFSTLLLFFAAAAPQLQRGTQWQNEAKAAVAAMNANDVAARVAALSKLHEDFPENSRVLRNLAWVQQQAGDLPAATALLRQYAAMGLTLPPDGPLYKQLAAAGLTSKIPQLSQNQLPVINGERVFTLPDPDLLIEDIAFDPSSGRHLLTSVRKKKIVSCNEHGDCRDVITSSPKNQLDGMLAIHVDAKRKWLWATTAGMEMQEDLRPDRKGKSALLKFDLQTWKLIKRYEPNDGKEHALGDMTIASNGDAYVADGDSGDVYVVTHGRDELEPLVPAGVFVSPQTPALNDSETALYVPDYSEGIAVIDLASRKVQWVKATGPVAFEGIDGLYFSRGALIAVQNGTVPERIVKFRLRGPDAVEGFSVIEANWPELGDPTHGTFTGGWFYFIANSGWNRVTEDGKAFKSGSAAEVWRVRLP